MSALEMKLMLDTFKTLSIGRIEKLFSSKVLKRDLSEILVYVLIIAYTVVFSYYTILKYNAFSAYAWDLGIFNQAFWTTLHDGKLFYYTVELFVNPSGSFMGSHFSPILFLMLPVYYLHPAPETLLAFQSFILALGAIWTIAMEEPLKTGAIQKSSTTLKRREKLSV